MANTVLYNTATKELARKQMFKDGYTINGQKPNLPNNIVELTILDIDRPELTATQKLGTPPFTWEADINNGLYKKQWNVVEKSDYEKALRVWIYPEYAKAITVEVTGDDFTTLIRELAKKGYIEQFRIKGNPMEIHPILNKWTVWIESVQSVDVTYFTTLLQEQKIAVHTRPQILNP